MSTVVDPERPPDLLTRGVLEIKRLQRLEQRRAERSLVGETRGLVVWGA